MNARASVGSALAAMYATVSAICALAPDVLPVRTILTSSLVGPPYLLVWGSGLWSPFASVSILLAGLTCVVMLSKAPEAKVIAGFAAVVVWVTTGFFAVALSV